MIIRKYGVKFVLVYDDGDFISEFDDFTSCLNKAKEMRLLCGENMIRIRCMRVYTSNYRKGSGDAVPISIAGKCAEGYKGLEYKKLAPKIGFWKEWEKTKDNEYYIHHFYDEVLFHLNPEEVLLELAEMSNGKDICLLCYEEENEFCHRFLVARWLNENLDYGFSTVEEMDYDEISEMIRIFKKTNNYDAIDENTFESESFRCEMENNLIERVEYDREEEYLVDAMKTIIKALNFCQYGDTSDANDEDKMLTDLTERDLLERLF